MNLSVIVKSYQRPWLLGICLESIARFWPRDRYDYEVIVADDGTQPELLAEVERRWAGGLLDKLYYNEAGQAKWSLCREGRFDEVQPTCGATWNAAHAAADGDIVFLIEDDSYLIRPSSPDACVSIFRNAQGMQVDLLCLIGLRERLQLDVHGISEAERVKEPSTGVGLVEACGNAAARATCPAHGSERWPTCMMCLAAQVLAIQTTARRPSPTFVDGYDAYRARETFALLKHPVWPWSFDGIFYRKTDWDQIGPWPVGVATGPMEHFVQTRLRELGWLKRRYGLAPDPLCAFDAQCSVRTDHPSTYLGRFRHVDACNAAWLSGEWDPRFEDVVLGRLPWDRARTVGSMMLHYPAALRQINFVTGHELCGELHGEDANQRWLAQARAEAARYGEEVPRGIPETCRSE